MTEEAAAGYHRTKRRGSTMIEWLMALVMAAGTSGSSCSIIANFSGNAKGFLAK